MLTLCDSGTLRECSQHHSRASHARALEPPLPLQLALQFPRYRISVCLPPCRQPGHEADSPRYIVVDLMNGGDLRFHISRKTFTEEAVRFWIAQLGCAVRYIHQQGIVHRDIKPDNVLLDSEGHVHLADFVRSIPPTSQLSLTLPERRLRLHAPQAADEQVWHARLPGSRSVRRQRILVRSRLVVTGCALLRVHLQQATL